MASAVASEVAEVPKPVSAGTKTVAAASAGTKTVASASHLSSTEGAAPRSSSDDVKDSTDVKDFNGVKDSTDVKDSNVVKDSTGVKGSNGVKDSTGVKGSNGVKDSTDVKDFNGVKDSTDVKDSNGVKDSTGEVTAAAAAGRTRGRYIPLPKLFATRDVLDPFPEAAMQDLLQALELAEDVSGAASMTGFSPGGRFWISKEDADVVQLKMAMPGLGKEHVKMTAKKDTLMIKGEVVDKDSEGGDDKGQPRYNYRVGLSSQAFKLDQIKAEMKNGVLMVIVPKIKDEERKDVFEIKVE